MRSEGLNTTRKGLFLGIFHLLFEMKDSKYHDTESLLIRNNIYVIMY